MTDIKTRGFKDPAELRERLAELEDEPPAVEAPQAAGKKFRLEIEELQKDVSELKRRVNAISAQRRSHHSTERHPWLRIFATAAATFVLGRVFSGLRLGTTGAVAVPLLATKAGERIVQSVSQLTGPR